VRTALVLIIAVVLAIASSEPASAQESSIRGKDPAAALAFAWLCPGCGHLYSGETTRGALIAAISIGSVAVGAAIQLTRDVNVDCSLAGARPDCRATNTDLTPVLVGGAIGLAGYVYGLIDARSSVERMNARKGIGLRGIEVRPSVAADGSVAAHFTIPTPIGW
jgi:hypothetical protein